MDEGETGTGGIYLQRESNGSDDFILNRLKSFEIYMY